MVTQAIKKGTGIQKRGLNAWKEKTGMIIDKPKEDEIVQVSNLSNANKEQIFLDPKDYQEDDSEKNYSNHVLEGGDLLIKCSKFCRDYKVSPIYFISKLSEHLYCMHERYAPKDKK